MTTKTHHPERRQHPRVPVLSSFIRLISIDIPDWHIKDKLPGIMGNLSAGGMTIATFAPIPLGTELELSMDLPELSAPSIKGKVIRVDNKEGSCLISILFTRIDQKTKDRISKMAQEHQEKLL
jgi:hypothetical protein